jgi:hypothetical protein
VIITTVALGLLAPTAQAAPFSPTLEFGYELATQHLGAPVLCTEMDLQTVANAPGFLGESSATPIEAEPCYIYAARRLAAPREFGAACRLMFNAVATLDGSGATFAAMPHACRSHLLYVWNNPEFWR